MSAVLTPISLHADAAEIERMHRLFDMQRNAFAAAPYPDLAARKAKLPDVLECHLMAGDCDFLLRVAVADLDAYRQFQIRHLNHIAGVQNTKTEIPMQRIKQTTELPL